MSARGPTTAVPTGAAVMPRIWLAAGAPPVVWMAQGTAGWYIAARTCPSEAGYGSSSGAGRLLLAALTAAALLVTVAAFLAARRAWRRSSPAPSPLVEERVRFVATLGLVASGTLTLGLALAGLPLALLSACGGTP
jgi:hypothetical protein